MKPRFCIGFFYYKGFALKVQFEIVKKEVAFFEKLGYNIYIVHL